MGTSVTDIDAKIAELQKQKKKILEAEKAAKKKEQDARRLKIGTLVEKVLGEVTDMQDFEKKLMAIKNSSPVAAPVQPEAHDTNQVSLN
ncbi:MAG: hypothetical protein J6I68_04035 [Butyrivibrio sp.]|uniref:hypothetical protein n=1 Tax=Butyrivibrio sp. TaxID=28121 RepID=UPI001B4AD4A4|nr:hypothetical protein [Butyrivibrio sp.]MBP3782397.1 hypothetical protein [Butyrivibrio sp.]